MKKFTINCDFGGQMSPFTIFIGKPEHAHHPLHFQSDWLSKQRGGMIPGDVMEAVTQLQELAEKNGVSLEELCVYALGTPEEQAALAGEGDDGSQPALEGSTEEESVNTEVTPQSEAQDSFGEELDSAEDIKSDKDTADDETDESKPK